jgi:hypothetical protein
MQAAEKTFAEELRAGKSLPSISGANAIISGTVV